MTPFDLQQPDSFADAVGLLDPDDPTVRAISGGTALMLMMKAGVFRPSRLVSLRRVEQHYFDAKIGPEGSLSAGALVRLGDLERSAEVRRAFPILADTLRVLSNVRVRNVATVGGNLAHGDPLMDLPPVLIALDAEVEAIGPGARRTIPLSELFTGYYETALQPDELIGSLSIPAQNGRVAAYIKCTTRSAHDWPALGVAVSLDVADGTIRQPHIVVSAATETPTRMGDAEAAIDGAPVGDAAFQAAAEAAAERAEVISDVRGSGPYKMQLIRVNVARALAKAVAGERKGIDA